MINTVATSEDGNRTMIASVHPEERRRMGEIAKAAGLRAVGFIREAKEVIPRALLSTPEVILIDVDFFHHMQEQNVLLPSLYTFLPVTVVLFGKQIKQKNSAHWRLAGIHETLDTDDPLAQNADSLALLIKKLQKDHGTALCSAMTSPSAKSYTTDKRKVLSPSCVVVGCSTGGPVALMSLLKGIPENFPLPIAVVQHMPPTFTSILAERLNAECALHIVEAQAGMPFEDGKVYIAPGGYHMLVEGDSIAPRIDLNQAPQENSCRPAVDVLFRSSAKIFRGHQHVIVLTGMGRDGLSGAMQLHGLGARIVVQDAATSTVWGMPGAIAQAGYADEVLPLEQIAPQLLRCI